VRRDDKRVLSALLVIDVLWLVFLSLTKGVSGGGVGHRLRLNRGAGRQASWPEYPWSLYGHEVRLGQFGG
jgi:hypothetical protein